MNAAFAAQRELAGATWEETGPLRVRMAVHSGVAELRDAGFAGPVVYGVEGPGWPLEQEWADPRRREQILFAARAAETDPSLIGFSHHFIASGTKGP